MPSGFLKRTIEVFVDARTWAGGVLPSALKKASRTTPIDVADALHMLGTITMPNALSPASPALSWAWLRYYLAPTSDSDLRITMDFADLDPHQKGILSDDFGVAIATQWMHDRFGGFADIVDGRRFVMQFPQLLRKEHRSKAKVGPSKTPDFVIRDLSNHWHVLECKGTQTGPGFQEKTLGTGTEQKRAIDLVGSIKGERLAAALFIANEKQRSRSCLKVVDPDEPPLIRLTEHQADEMNAKARRIGVARALGMIGLSEIATELSLPAGIDPDSGLLRPSEASRVRSSRDARIARAREQARERLLTRFQRGDRTFDGREARFELPPDALAGRFRRVTIRQGVDSDLIDELSTAGALAEESLDAELLSFGPDGGIMLASEDSRLLLRYGRVSFSEVIWEKRKGSR